VGFIVGLIVAVAPAAAWACDTQYWNIACRYFSPGTGETAPGIIYKIHYRVVGHPQGQDTWVRAIHTTPGAAVGSNPSS